MILAQSRECVKQFACQWLSAGQSNLKAKTPLIIGSFAKESLTEKTFPTAKTNVLRHNTGLEKWYKFRLKKETQFI